LFSEEEKSFILPYVKELLRLKDDIEEEFRKLYDSKIEKTSENIKRVRKTIGSIEFFSSTNDKVKDLRKQLESLEQSYKNEQKNFIKNLEKKIAEMSLFFTTMLMKIKSIIDKNEIESKFLEMIDLLKSNISNLMNNAEDNIDDKIRACFIALGILGAGILAATTEAGTAGAFLGPVGCIFAGLGAASIGTALKDKKIKSKLEEIISAYQNYISQCKTHENDFTKKIEGGIHKILKILLKSAKKTLQKQILVFLPKDQENEFFCEMLKENFRSVLVQWITNEKTIKNLKLEENENMFPYVIISSYKYYGLINEMIIYDTMFKGLIIYTSNVEKFVTNDKHPTWPKFVVDEPYSVFEKTKYLIENIETEVYFCSMYSLISKFEGETLKCLSAKNLQVDSLEDIPAFSIEKIFYALKLKEFDEFRNEFKIVVEDAYNPNFIKQFSKAFQNDLKKYYDLFTNNLPKCFLDYLFLFPINPQDPLYEIMFSNYIHEQMNNPQNYVNHVKRQSLLERANYIELLLNLMRILNEDSEGKDWKIAQILRVYTSELFCSKINKYFLFMNHKVLENFKNVLSMFSYAFSHFKDGAKLPKRCYRNIRYLEKETFKINYKIGDRLIFPAFTSTSSSNKPELAELGNIKFIIEIDPNIPDVEKPKSLEKVSDNPDEEEFLFKCFSCFEILSIENSKETNIDYECKIRHLLLSDK